MPIWTNIGGLGGGAAGNPFGASGAWKARVSGFPRWGLPVILLASIPGLAIALLSIVLLVASLLALLLLTLPAYKVVVWINGFGRRSPEIPAAAVVTRPGSKPVDVRVIDP